MTADFNAPHIGLVVEGRGDHGAIPVLLRRWLYDRGIFDDILGKPIPCHGKGNATSLNGIEGFVATAAARPGCRGVLVVLDADEDAVCQLGPTLLARSLAVIGKPIAVCLAEKDFEDWLYASIETLELGEDLQYVANCHGAAEIAQQLRPRKYVKPTWQPRLTAKLDIQLASSRSPSFRRTLARFEQLLTDLDMV
jgi:hypothetical protein